MPTSTWEYTITFGCWFHGGLYKSLLYYFLKLQTVAEWDDFSTTTWMTEHGIVVFEVRGLNSPGTEESRGRIVRRQNSHETVLSLRVTERWQVSAGHPINDIDTYLNFVRRDHGDVAFDRCQFKWSCEIYSCPVELAEGSRHHTGWVTHLECHINDIMKGCKFHFCSIYHIIVNLSPGFHWNDCSWFKNGLLLQCTDVTGSTQDNCQNFIMPKRI